MEIQQIKRFFKLVLFSVFLGLIVQCFRGSCSMTSFFSQLNSRKAWYRSMGSKVYVENEKVPSYHLSGFFA